MQKLPGAKWIQQWNKYLRHTHVCARREMIWGVSDAESAKWHISEHLRWHIHSWARRRLLSLWLINRRSISLPAAEPTAFIVNRAQSRFASNRLSMIIWQAKNLRIRPPIYKTRACGWVSLAGHWKKNEYEWEMCSSRCEYCVGGAGMRLCFAYSDKWLLITQGSFSWQWQVLLPASLSLRSFVVQYNTAPYNLICLQRAHTIYQLFGLTL